MANDQLDQQMAVVSFRWDDENWGKLRVHADAFPPNWGLLSQPTEKFLEEIILSGFRSRTNKVAVVATLNTWYKVFVVGMDGEIRGKPRMIRHRPPGGIQGEVFWGITRKTLHSADEARNGEFRIKYNLVPFKGPFECRSCGIKFKRYEGQICPYSCLNCPPCEKHDEASTQLQGALQAT